MSRIDTHDYRHEFIGILNADGDFWTPLAFDNEAEARAHISKFWGQDTEKREECLRKFSFVPVRIVIETIDDAPAADSKGEQ
jgi:hypothetical protein